MYCINNNELVNGVPTEDNRKYVFIGNRFYVYAEMIRLNLNIVKIFAEEDSYLSKYLDKHKINYSVASSKRDLIASLEEIEYDVLISNGCKYILPVTQLNCCLKEKYGRSGTYVNVHTSLLPDCKGKHPVNAAILFDRKHGVTCHLMDDGIDTGKIIDQIEIPINSETSLDLIYKLSFISEGEVFKKAYAKKFIANIPACTKYSPIYYSREEDDLYIKYTDDFEHMNRRIRAFSSKGMYAKIQIGESVYCVKSCQKINNSYIRSLFKNRNDYEICLSYGECILFKMHSEYIEFVLMNWDPSFNDFDEIVGKNILLK